MQITQTILEDMLGKIITNTTNNDLFWNNYLQEAVFSDGEKLCFFLESKKIKIAYIDLDSNKTNFTFSSDTVLMDNSWFSTLFNNLSTVISTQMSNLEQTKLTSLLNKMT